MIGVYYHINLESVDCCMNLGGQKQVSLQETTIHETCASGFISPKYIMVSETRSINQCSNTVSTVWSRKTVFSWVRLASSVKPTNNWSDLRSLPLDKSEIFHQQKISMSEASTVWCLVSVSTVDLGNHCPFFWNFLERHNLSMIYIKSGFRSFLWTSALGSEFWAILEGHHTWPLFFCFMLSEAYFALLEES